MASIKRLTILTIVLNFFIIVGAGHGIGTIGLLEIFWLPQFYSIGTEDFSYSLNSSFDQILGFVALLSLIGQLLLLSAIFIEKIALVLSVTGLLILWIGFYYIIHNAFENEKSQISFVTGIPFLISSAILAYRIIKRNK